MANLPQVDSVWGPNPKCTRGSAFALNSSVDGTKIGYGSVKNVVVRDTADPSLCSVSTVHRANVTVTRFSNSESKMQLLSCDEGGQTTMFEFKGNELSQVKQLMGLGGKITDAAWYANDNGLACVGDAKPGGRVFTTSGTDKGNISGTKRVNSVDIFFFDDNRKDVSKARIATTCDDLRLRIFHYKGGFSLLEQDVERISFKTNCNMARFSPEGDFLVAVGGKQIKVLDTQNGYKTLAETTGDKKKGEHTGNIYAVAWNSDGKLFATVSADKSLKLWNFDGTALKLMNTVSFANKSAFGPAVSDFQVGICYVGDGAVDRFAALSLSGDINFVTVKGTELEVDSTVIAPTGAITGMDVDRDAGTVAVSSVNGEVVVYDKAGNGKRIKGLKDPKNCIGVANLGDSVMSAGYDDVLRYAAGEELKVTNRTMALGGQPVFLRRADNNQNLLVVLTKNDLSIVEKSKPNAAIAKLKGGNAEFQCAALNADGSKLVVGTADKKVRIYDVAGGNITLAGEVEETFSFDVSTLAFNPAGDQFAIGLASKYVILCDISGKQLSDSWTKHGGRIADLDFSPDGKWLLSAGANGEIGIWNASKPNSFTPKKFVQRAHMAGLAAAKWLDNTTFYSAGSYDATVKRWTVTF